MAEFDNVSDELDALINGHVPELSELPKLAEEEVETQEEEKVEVEEVEETSVTDNEDTTQVETEVEEPETTDIPDVESGEETAEVTEEEVAENAPVEVSSEEESETEEVADVAAPETTEETDYKKQYEELLETSKKATDFYDKVANAKFKANGKEVQGFKDPDKIIQSQQMSYNYSAKMAGFNKHKPVLATLKDRGLLEDPEKFDLAMSILDGDKEALKTHIKNLEIDPLDLDMDNIAYERTSKVASDTSIVMDEALETAKEYGVEDKVYNTVLKEWDRESFEQFVKNPYVRDDLIKHMADGSYDVIMTKVKELEMLDSRYAGLDSVSKYQTAIRDINSESTKTAQNQFQVPNVTPVQEAVVAEPEPVIETATEKVYKDKVVKENRKAEEARKKATQATKATQKASKPKVVDPMDYTGSELSSYLDKLIMGK